MLETDLCRTIIRLVTAKNGLYANPAWRLYQEVPFIAGGQTYSADLVWMHGDTMSECVLHAWQVKRSLTPELIEQGRILYGLADATWLAVPEPGNQTATHQARRRDASRAGLGLVYVADDRLTVMEEPRPPAHITTRLAESCVAGQHGGPAAGSAAVRRVKADEWEPVRAILRVEQGLEIKDIGRRLTWTPAQRQTFTTAVWHGRIRGLRIERYVVPIKVYCDE